MKLSLYIPAKPYIVTQAFGIYNPAYLQFGFDKHNGVDFKVDTDGIVNAMCDGVVTDVGFNSGAGNFVRYRTKTPVEAEGRTAYVEFMYMHAEKALVKKGDVVSAGDDLIIADNTGFSTGPHTHISAYLINENGYKQEVLDPRANHCFDFAKYYNGKYAADIKEGLTAQIKKLQKAIADWIAKQR